MARRPGQAVGRTRLAARASARQRARRPRARGRRSLAVSRARLAARRVGARARVGLPPPLHAAAARSSSRASTTRRPYSSTARSARTTSALFTPFDCRDRATASTCSRSSCIPAPESEPQVGRTSLVRVHKPRMNYGWDFCPRLVHQGIWQSVRLDAGAPPSAAGDARGRRRRRAGRRRGGARSPIRSSGGRTGSASRGSTVSGSEDRTRRRLPHGRAASTTTRSSSTASATLDEGLELDADRSALRRAAAGEARAPAAPRAARERQSAAGVGRRADRDRAVLRALRPARASRLAGVQPVELRHGERSRCGRRVRRAHGGGRARDRPAPAAPSFARDLVRRKRARTPTSRIRFSQRSRDVVQELDPGAGRGCRPRRLGDDVHGPWEHQGLRAHYERYDGASGEALQRVRRRRDDEPPRARVADRRGASLARRPLEPGLRAPRRLVEQRAARAGLLRRTDPRRRDDAPREPVAAVRRAPLCRRGVAAARMRHDPVAVLRIVSERVVHSGGRLARRAEARVLGRCARVSPRSRIGSVQDVRLGRRGGGARADLRRPAGTDRRSVRHGRRRGRRRDRRAARRLSRPTSSCSTSRAATVTS